jgi:UDP-N-acetylglucosamine diphosphorylase / glucose-1-phosphate thymidylyltransferase / UDP-N-acetylgalactosamine diphosphorylase / glucosamine-1-phosphate N-acetyltransferase / galactosamine-1-phosphate N-acetyltransferase
MQAVILAAGEGRRLRPLTRNRPKVMLPVGGRPILEHVITALAACDVRDLTFVVGHRRESIQSHFGDGRDWGVRITYAVQERQLGTGHALRVGLEAQRPTEPFLVLAGDNHVREGLVRDLLAAPGAAAVATTRSGEAAKYGVVHVEGDRVTRIEEKPPEPMTRLISTGIYRLPPLIYDYLGGPEGTALTDAVNRAVHAGLELVNVPTEDAWQDAVYPWDLLDLNDRVLRDLESDARHAELDAGVITIGECRFGAGTRVRHGSYIIGPVLVGRNCDIGPNVVMKGPVTLGDHVRVGPFTEIEDSLVMDSVHIDTGAIVRHAIVDDGARLGPRVSMDRGPAILDEDEGLIRTDRLGAVIGQDAFLGANVVLEPGAIIGNESSVAPNRVARRVPDRGTAL